MLVSAAARKSRSRKTLESWDIAGVFLKGFDFKGIQKALRKLDLSAPTREVVIFPPVNVWRHLQAISAEFRVPEHALHEYMLCWPLNKSTVSMTPRWRGNSRCTLTAKSSHGQEISQQGDLTAKRSLARKLLFHILTCWTLKDVWHEGFVVTFFTLRFWRRYRTKASFSHLPLSDCEGGLARKLRFHILTWWTLRDVSSLRMILVHIDPSWAGTASPPRLPTRTRSTRWTTSAP